MFIENRPRHVSEPNDCFGVAAKIDGTSWMVKGYGRRLAQVARLG
jgi:hypothetical protein